MRRSALLERVHQLPIKGRSQLALLAQQVAGVISWALGRIQPQVARASGTAIAFGLVAVIRGAHHPGVPIHRETLQLFVNGPGFGVPPAESHQHPVAGPDEGASGILGVVRVHRIGWHRAPMGRGHPLPPYRCHNLIATIEYRRAQAVCRYSPGRGRLGRFKLYRRTGACGRLMLMPAVPGYNPYSPPPPACPAPTCSADNRKSARPWV